MLPTQPSACDANVAQGKTATEFERELGHNGPDEVVHR